MKDIKLPKRYLLSDKETGKRVTKDARISKRLHETIKEYRMYVKNHVGSEDNHLHNTLTLRLLEWIERGK